MDDGKDTAEALPRRELLMKMLEDAEKDQASKMEEIRERVERLEDMSKQYLMNQMMQHMQHQLNQQLQAQGKRILRSKQQKRPSSKDPWAKRFSRDICRVYLERGTSESSTLAGRKTMAESSVASCRTRKDEEEELMRLTNLEKRIKTVERRLKSITRELQNSLREKDELRLKLMDLETKLLLMQGENLAKQMMNSTPTEEDLWQLEKLKRIAAERARYCRNLSELDRKDRKLNEAIQKAERIAATTPIVNVGENRKQVVFNEDTLRKEEHSSSEELVEARPEDIEALERELATRKLGAATAAEHSQPEEQEEEEET
ncbi:hypothetical protein AAG570_003183 [Ranatra chinensis]|uniref:Uncharacterized protein n=1 Tax=Ranatra chinensis TaxID=642074 RepID=A0ABD0YKC0_9HEMI